MKKFLTFLSLATLLAFAGCRGSSNTNTNVNSNMNMNMATATPTPVMQTNESAKTDTTLKTKVEDALKKKGFTNVTVDMTTTPATLRGTVAKGKLTEVVATAQEAAGKPFNNQVQEK